MRIDAYNQINTYYSATTKKPQVKAKAAYGTTTDQVSFSTVAKDIQTAKAAAASTPDVRADKVADVKSRMQAGTYNVTGDEFADKVISAYYG